MIFVVELAQRTRDNQYGWSGQFQYGQVLKSINFKLLTISLIKVEF
jgi:hypothetical protein